MSHISTIQTQIRNLDALRAACEDLHVRLIDGGQVQGYYRGMARADYRIELPGTRYQVGVVRQQDGTYALQADFWGGHVERTLGKGYGLLLQRYGLHVITHEAKRRGKAISATQLPDGRIQVRIAG